MYIQINRKGFMMLMPGKANVSWGGLVGGGISSNVTLENGMIFDITSAMFGLQIGAAGSDPKADVLFDPSQLINGHYFTSIAGVAFIKGVAALSFANHIFGPQIGSITFSGLGLGINLSLGDSTFRMH
ncbi:MAG: hypothetical protein H7245_09360 [Candidatus Saccharibacteria bacterium]|nr:hypothetical protein [Pseudorhodobacter sp.]